MADNDKNHGPWTPFRIVGVYALIGVLWILFSDRVLVLFVSDPYVISELQTYKGWFYVLVTSLLLYGLISRMSARQKQIENELTAEKHYNRGLFESSPMGLALCRMDGSLVDVNAAYAGIIGKTVGEALKLKYWDITPEPYIALAKEQLIELRSRGRYGPIEKEIIHNDGHLVPIRIQGVLMEKEGERFILSSIEDISEHRKAGLALSESEERFRRVVENIPDVVVIYDTDLRIRYINRATVRLTGRPVSDYTGKRDEEIWPPEVYQAYLPTLREALHAKSMRSLETDLMLPGGKLCNLVITSIPLLDKNGDVIEVLGITHDLTHQKEAEAKLRKSEALLIETQHLTRVGGWEFDVEKGEFVWTDEVYRIHDVDPDSFNPSDMSRNTAFYSEGDREIISRAFELAITRGEAYDLELKFVSAKGKHLWVRTIGKPIVNDNKIVRVVGNIMDITDRKRAEEAHENLQKELLHAQKMESIGRLAGGVAHDFNNMILVIVGNAEMAMKHLDPNQQPYEHLREIQKSAQRSADLTKQLLAFARKQAISPKVLNLNDMVAGMLKILNRIIGEDIDLVWKPAEDPWMIKIDPTQVDQILANLAVNARDAIDSVGTLTIETKNVVIDETYQRAHADFVPGEYVLLAVSDNGSGMDGETLERLFEPFFTTKSAGKGTGLGLATIYGIVKQNDGFINVYSESGNGTTFKIYLHRAAEEDRMRQAAPDGKIPLPGSETLLLVEDEAAILKLGKAILEEYGYTVLAARMPSEALAISEQHQGAIDLLITDIILPEMNGRDLQSRIIKMRPGIRTLYISGYTADVIASQGGFTEGFHFLQKPFSPLVLASNVREILDRG